MANRKILPQHRDPLIREQKFIYRSNVALSKKVLAIEDVDSLVKDLGDLGGITDLPVACERMLIKSQKRLEQEFATSSSEADLQPSGERIRDYDLRELLGMGGMGAVYRAKHVRLGREVAIKILSPKYLNSQAAEDRFEHEMIAAGKLSHPNIVTALDAGCEAGIHYLVMELIEGFNGSQLVELLGPISIADAAQIVLLAAKGIEYVHKHGLIHRDIKPSNLMVTMQGNVQVLDLGLSFWHDAKSSLRPDPKVLGTLDYMPPEQLLDSDQVDHRADIYNLGRTFLFLTGHSRHSKLTRQGERPDVFPSRKQKEALPPKLEIYLGRMIAKSADERPDSMAEVIQQFACWSDGADLVAMVTHAQQLQPESTVENPAVIPSDWLKPRRKTWRRLLGHVLSKRGVAILLFALACAMFGYFTLDPTRPISKKTEVVRQPTSTNKTSAGPKFLVPEDFGGEQDTIHEAIVEDSLGEWFLRVGSLSGVHITRKLQGKEGDSSLVCEARDVQQFRIEYPTEYAMIEKYLPADLLRVPIIDFKKPLPPEVRLMRVAQRTPLGGQFVHVQTRQLQLSISDLGVIGGVKISVTSNGERSRYTASNRVALRRDNPEIAKLLDRYAKRRVIEFPKPNVSSIPTGNLKQHAPAAQEP